MQLTRSLPMLDRIDMGKCLFIFVYFLFFSLGTKAQITGEDLGKIIESFHKEYDAELKQKKSRIEINPVVGANLKTFWWDLDQVHASYSGYFDQDENVFIHYLYLLGGYGRLPGMTRDGVVATLCHELGHGLGGAPYKVNDFETTQVSVEGQADYFAYRYCVPRIFKRLNAAAAVKPVNDYTDKQCRTLPKASYSVCTRSFQSLESERLFFRLNPDDPNSEYDRRDSTIAKTINTDAYFYPTSQCRLDTMMNAILGKDRPSCWFTTTVPSKIAVGF
jgi:hypothetical protein